MKSPGVRLLVLVVCAVLVGAFIAREPWLVYNEQRAKTARAEAEMRRLETERAQLLQKKAQAQSSIGKERMARERNFVKDGEVRVSGEGL